MTGEDVRWVVVKYDVQPPLLLCERCGESRALKLPMSIDDLGKLSKAYIALHKLCPPKEVPA